MQNIASKKHCSRQKDSSFIFLHLPHCLPQSLFISEMLSSVELSMVGCGVCRVLRGSDTIHSGISQHHTSVGAATLHWRRHISLWLSTFHRRKKTGLISQKNTHNLGSHDVTEMLLDSSSRFVPMLPHCYGISTRTTHDSIRGVSLLHRGQCETRKNKITRFSLPSTTHSISQSSCLEMH